MKEDENKIYSANTARVPRAVVGTSTRSKRQDMKTCVETVP